MSVTRRLEQLLLLSALSCSLWISALSAATITHLPGFDGPLPFHLETGYVKVDEATQAELFYYFIESEREPGEDPLILWLTGGPGCTSFYGLVREIGPIRFKIAPYDGNLPTFVSNPYAWTKFSNIIFLDWPAVTGFSFLRNAEDYIGDDIKSLNEIYSFLKQWFLDHPHFLSNPFYVGGNSYGGKMVPIVAYKVVEGIETGRQPVINLKGYICGNPATNSIIDGNSRVSYAHRVGIISDELFEAIQRSCPGEDYLMPTTCPCIEQIKIFMSFLSELMLDNILIMKCQTEPGPIFIDPPEEGKTMNKRKLSELHAPPPLPDITCSTYASYLSNYWANNNDTRKALHVKEGTVKEWQICNPGLFYIVKAIHSSVPYHHTLLTRGYRALIFSGDHDLAIPYTGTMEWIESFNLPIVEPWRSWHVNGQVGGYTVKYSKNLTFATVKGGSHGPSKNMPQETFAIFQRWISHQPL